ncbi:hypothetical protein CQA72_21985, partial [Klebsiella pneumoniae]
RQRGGRAEVLPPLVARLRQACPNIVIELMLSNRFQDLLHREADIACGWSPAAGAAYRPPSRQDRAWVTCHRAYLTRQGLPRPRRSGQPRADWFR